MKHKIALVAGAMALAAGASLGAATTAAADPAGWVGPFSSDWTCGQRASQMMGSAAPAQCTYRKNDSRGAGYYFVYQP
ncbi:hypothetical protein [Mycobacteroides abscessus]|nr:hypothetical protein [Mycobacteroides abscessus]MDO3357778.1 hypothetical protein [Mycobacteroides abscessus subsp. massiliense]WKE45651.1 hypothetical protein P3M63_07555 [Mycobacteroides abscessus subsp. massiliense]BBX38527.1 hypothetical protein MMAGJ_78090 [Mycolicibacterium mageritense]CDO24097.1 hypothetical protein BN978_04589 [Mycolicibacterium mageritense DSM 44476 = CIP 104973]